MKRIMILVGFFVLIFYSANGQDFKNLKLGIGIGYGLAGDGGHGGEFYLEPMYRVDDKIAIGIKYEQAALPGNVTASSVIPDLIVNSFTLTGQYYFNTDKFRPFIGAGMGLFILTAVNTDILFGPLSINPSTNSFGLFPRVGFDYGHFNLTIDYNIVSSELPSQPITILFIPVGSTTARNASYFALKVGFAFGGGHGRKP